MHRPSQGNFTLNVFDPATPTPLALSLDFGSVSPQFQRLTAIQVNPAAGTFSQLPSPWLVYVRGTQLFQVDMALGKAPSPAALAGMNDVCRLDALFRLDGAGRSGLAAVVTAGADGNCASDADNRTALLRIGDAPSTSPTRPPAETQFLGPDITDAEGRLLWVMATETVDRPAQLGSPTSQLVAYKPNLERVAVTGGMGKGSLSWPSSGPLASGVWAKSRTGTGSWELVRLTGSADALSLSTGPGDIASSSQAHFGPMVDQGQAYEVNFARDGLLRVAADGSQQALGRLDPAAGRVDLLTQNAAYLLVIQSTSAGNDTWTLVRKSDGNSRTLLSGVSSRLAQLVALGESRLVYRTQTDRDNGELRSIDLASGNDTVLVSNMVHPQVGAVSLVGPASGRLFGSTGPNFAAAVLACRPQQAAGDCRDNDLVQANVDTGELTVLGRFPASNSPARITLSGFAVMGQAGTPLTLSAISVTPASRLSDTYVIEAGRAASLQRVTNAIP